MTKKNALPELAVATALPPARDPTPQPVEMPNPGGPVGPPPVEMPVPSQPPTPIAESPVEADLRRSKQGKPHVITTRAFDYFYDRAEQHFVRLNSLGAALKRAGRELKERVVEKDGVFDLRPLSPLEKYLESRALRVRKPAGALDVAARRREWDEAKRSGDPDGMTRTANALIRAIEASRAETGHTPKDIGEMLNPERSADALAEEVHQVALAQEASNAGVANSPESFDIGIVPAASDEIRDWTSADGDWALDVVAQEDSALDDRSRSGEDIVHVAAPDQTDAAGHEGSGRQPVTLSSSRQDPPLRRSQETDRVDGDIPHSLPWDERLDVWPPAPPPNREPRVGRFSNDVPDKFQPGEWRQQQQPTTANGSVLVDKGDLPPQLRRNLEQREWRSPTGRAPARSTKLSLGWGYFGAYRGDDPQTRTYHGALDFTGDDVVMPTRARLKKIKYEPGQGWTLTFDLGDGIEMSLHHVVPSEEVQRRYLAGDIDFDMGHPLGRIDTFAYANPQTGRLSRNDHVHMQIKLRGGRYRGQRVPGLVVDPTPFFPDGGWRRPFR